MDQTHQLQHQQFQTENVKVGVFESTRFFCGGGGLSCGNQLNVRNGKNNSNKNSSDICKGKSSINGNADNSFPSSSSPSTSASLVVKANGKSSNRNGVRYDGGSKAGKVVTKPLRINKMSQICSSFSFPESLNVSDGISSEPNDDSPFQSNWLEKHHSEIPRIIPPSCTFDPSVSIGGIGDGLNRFQQRMLQLQMNGGDPTNITLASGTDGGGFQTTQNIAAYIGKRSGDFGVNYNGSNYHRSVKGATSYGANTQLSLTGTRNKYAVNSFELFYVIQLLYICMI